MAWREEITRYAENGDVSGVLKIFDELWNDRDRARGLNAAYLQYMHDFGMKPGVDQRDGTLDALRAACAQLKDALSRIAGQ